MKLCGYKIGGALCFAVAGWLFAVGAANADPVISLGEHQRLANICAPNTQREVIDRVVEQDTRERRSLLQQINDLWQKLGEDKSSQLQDYALARHAREWCLADKTKSEPQPEPQAEAEVPMSQRLRGTPTPTTYKYMKPNNHPFNQKAKMARW